MIVTVSSVRGAPGVTSWALLLAAAWPTAVHAERVVLEADLAGGVLAARYGLGIDPGVVSLIAALRRSTDEPVQLGDHARLVNDGVWVVPGPETGEQARKVWTGTSSEVAERLSADERLWIVDAGRMDGASPLMTFAANAMVAIVVCGARPEDLVQVPSRVALLGGSCPRVGVLVVGKPAYPLAELVRFFATELVWIVGASPDLPELTGALLAGGRARRSWLWRTAVDTAVKVAGHAVRTSSLAEAPRGRHVGMAR